MKKRRFLMGALLLLLALTIWVPLWLLISGSFMGSQEMGENLAPILKTGKTGYALWPLLPQYPTFRSYVELLVDSPQFFTMFWNSCIQVFPIILGQVLIGAPAAWAFGRYRFKGRKALFSLYMILMMMPFQVTMVSNYLVLDSLHLIDTIWSIIIPGAVSTFPVFVMTRFFAAIPESLMEAASLDGAGALLTFWHIGIPVGAPGILSAVVLGFLEYWNALEQPLVFLKEQTRWPLSLYLPTVTTDNAGASIVASVIMLIPALLIFLFGQKYLEQGISASGLKD